MVIVGAAIDEIGHLRQHQKAVGETGRDVELAMVDVVQLQGERAAEVRRAAPDVHGHIQHPATGDAHQLALGVFALVMQAAQHAASRAGMIVLHEGAGDALRGQDVFAEAFDEKSPGIAMHDGLDEQDAGQGGFLDVHGTPPWVTRSMR